MSKALAHVRSLWGPWWPLPGGFFVAYAATLAIFGEMRLEHPLIAVLVALLAYWGPRTKQFIKDMVPFLVLAVGYDLVRYAQRLAVQADDVIIGGIRRAELALFAVGPNTTVQDYFAQHHWAVADMLAAVPYCVFVYFAFVYAAFLFFVDRPRMRYFLWALAIANYISFVMWLVVPTAPPWYIREYGLVVDLSTPPYAAGLLRVDQLFGMHYFQEFYSRASSVFGAMPSMHCAYPMLGLLTAWRSTTWKTRPLHLVYAAWMAWAAVYLDHHWVWDVIAGWAVALVSVLAAGYALRRLGNSVTPMLGVPAAPERNEPVSEQLA